MTFAEWYEANARRMHQAGLSAEEMMEEAFDGALDDANARIAQLEKRVERAETRTVEIDERQWTDHDELIAALHRARKNADVAEEALDVARARIAQLEPDAKLGQMVREMPQGNLFRDDLGLFGWREWDARENDRWSCPTPEQALGLEEPDPEE
jgi:predicted  nucleic acid-binding Zn-ribbon protein